MKLSEYGRITDELLSAYIDNAVTEQDRDLVEAAVAADAEVAWRLDTLEQTVQLLRTLPELAMPRSFTLQQSQLLDVGPSVADASPLAQEASWLGRATVGWRNFWQSGSTVYRNLAAASLVLLLVLVGGNTLMDASINTMSDVMTPAELAYSEAPAAMENDVAVPPNTDTVSEESAAAAEDIAPQAGEAAPAEDAAEVEAAATRTQEPMAAVPVPEMPAEESAAHQPEVAAAKAQAVTEAQPLARAAALPEVAEEGDAAPEQIEPFAAKAAGVESSAEEPLAMKAPAPPAAAPPAEGPLASAPPAAAPRAGVAPPRPDATGNAEFAADAASPSTLESEDDAGRAKIADAGEPMVDSAAGEDVETLVEASEAPAAEVAAARTVPEESTQATSRLASTEAMAELPDKEADEALAEVTAASGAGAGEVLPTPRESESDTSMEQDDASSDDTVSEEMATEEKDTENAADEVEAVAALPTAQPLPTTVQQTAPSDQDPRRAPGFGYSALDSLRLLANGLLVAAALFGGLWWRSRDTA